MCHFWSRSYIYSLRLQLRALQLRLGLAVVRDVDLCRWKPFYTTTWWVCNQSENCFKGKPAGTPNVWRQKQWFPVGFSLKAIHWTSVFAGNDPAAAQGISLGLLSPTLQPLLAMPPLNYNVQMLLGWPSACLNFNFSWAKGTHWLSWRNPLVSW